jgi:hypothetical protein
MARIVHRDLFGWNSVRGMPGLERFRMILEALEHEEFVVELERLRGKGRNDYAVRQMWNSILVFPLTGHCTWAAFRRELGRNRDLMAVCGFPVGCAPPSASAFSRFLKKVRCFQDEVDELIARCVEQLGHMLPDFGRFLAVDSQAVSSAAKSLSNRVTKDGLPDGRGEHDAENSLKLTDADGKTEVYKWFGFKNHLLCDTTYQLPILPLVAGGTSSDTKQVEPLLSRYTRRHPFLARRLEECTADMGYDSTDNILLARTLTEGRGSFLRPTRKTWKAADFMTENDRGKEVILKLLSTPGNEDLSFDEEGQVYCCAAADRPATWLHLPMVFKGYEADRKALKYVCHASHYGISCPGVEECEKGLGRSVRVKLDRNPRVFVPIPRHSPKFHRQYRRRTAIERINGLFEQLFHIKDMKVRGLSNTRLRISLIVLTTLTMAVARLNNQQEEKVASIVAAA